ncbi:thioredoxin domain-containing protein [Leptolyngbya sp. CCNP1308]|uniref:thioredoxin domain-containing protein n=1 Tax=Leptolyngbya sp. CCNP1308 TaxID=3110255 RepID=UPI002B21CDC2|nr:thioredoxin domain-containing protein [Leptolyngbya sp. CCNP1308]MEA5452300.1 thioredoxin domain-containing protein [Leptolyngbya sp. CCNP1308]
MVSLHRIHSWPRPNVSWLGGLALGTLLLAGCGPNSAQPVTNATSYEAQLAQHLADTSGVMYGAYWCPHCADQKAMFGEAVEQVPYVECAADGDNPQPELCEQKGIQGYPTWEIEGQLYPGVKSLDDLATLSGFLSPQ